MSDLISKNCKPCEGGVPKLTPEEIRPLMEKIPTWKLNENNTAITRSFSFKDFHQTMAFVNKVADISNEEGHHADMKVGYDYCVLEYSTHAIGGLSENDFICAAKVSSLQP